MKLLFYNINNNNNYFNEFTFYTSIIIIKKRNFNFNQTEMSVLKFNLMILLFFEMMVNIVKF
jgi:hypothetical protein